MKKYNFFQKKISNRVYKYAEFNKANFWEAKITNTTFSNCLFKESILCDVIFKNVYFLNCKIVNSNFSHSNFIRTKLDGCKLKNNNFRDVVVDDHSKGLKNITTETNIKKNKIVNLSILENRVLKALTVGKGYYVIKNYFPIKKINKAFAIVDKIVGKDKKIKLNHNYFARDKKFNQKWVYNLLNRDKVFVDLIQPKIVINVFKKLLGNDFICGFFGVNCLLPGARGQLPHLDFPYYRFINPGERVPFNSKNSFFLNCQVLIPLTKFDKENGSTGFLNHSHKLNFFPKQNEHLKKKFTQLKIDVGSMVIFNGLIWHLAKPNYSKSKKRYGLLSQYIPAFITPLLNLKKITNQKTIKNDKKNLKQLLGINLDFPSLRK